MNHCLKGAFAAVISLISLTACGVPEFQDVRLLADATAPATVLSADGVTLTKVAEHDFSVDACGGIAYSGKDNLFYVLQDHQDGGDWKAKVYPMTLDIDLDTGDFTTPTLGTAFTPGSNRDSEGIAYDSASGKLWISDEGEEGGVPSIAEFALDGTPSGRTAPIPSIITQQVRYGVSLESLTLSPDGLTMWTANEEALACDGEKSSTSVQTVVRLTKFTRADAASAWVAAGQWAYACDTCQSSLVASYQQCGLSDLCALEDGSLLVLEREVSTTTLGRCRIYRVTPEALSQATEVSSIDSLASASYTGVVKGAHLVEIKGGGLTSIIVYEGITLGPKLNDGSRAVYLVSDGGSTATKTIFGITVTAATVNRICVLKLSGLEKPASGSDDWDIPGAQGGINGKADGKGGKCVSFKSISLANGKLTVGFEAGKVAGDGQEYALLCKDSLTSSQTFTLSVKLTCEDDNTGCLATESLSELTGKAQLFVLGIGQAE